MYAVFRNYELSERYTEKNGRYSDTHTASGSKSSYLLFSGMACRLHVFYRRKLEAPLGRDSFDFNVMCPDRCHAAWR